jgi:hypothetical protein
MVGLRRNEKADVLAFEAFLQARLDNDEDPEGEFVNAPHSLSTVQVLQSPDLRYAPTCLDTVPIRRDFHTRVVHHDRYVSVSRCDL